MPSPRVISVAILVGMGAVVAAVGGLAGSHHPASGPDQSTVRGSLPSAASFDVTTENARPGTPGWRITRARGTHPGLEAYADAVSTQAGRPVALAVSGQGAVTIRAFRIGWYGGIGARLVWTGSLYAQPEPADPTGWAARGFAQTAGWPEGDYLIRLDQGEASRYLPLTVRSATTAGREVVLTSPISWEADNGPSSTGSAGGATSTGSGGAVKGRRTASFDRPYSAGYGSGGFLSGDLAVVQQAERSGRPLAYETDYDVATVPGLLSGAAAILTGGNSRFWTTSMRAAVETAAGTGTNLAFFGAGTGSRQVTLGAAGRSVTIRSAKVSTSTRLTGLRPSCAPDAASGSSSSISPSSVRSPATTGAGTTVGSGTGTTSGAGTAAGGSETGWTVSNAAWWGYHGAEVHTGDVLVGLVADGADRAQAPAATTGSTGTTGTTGTAGTAGTKSANGTAGTGGVTGKPASGAKRTVTQVLSFGRIGCAPSHPGGGPAGAQVVQSAVYQVRTSGAGVFDAGTGRWTCAAAGTCVDAAGRPIRVPAATERFAARVTRNVINGFGTAEAGHRHPARDTLGQYAALR